MHTLTQYLECLENSEGLCRRLSGFVPERTAEGSIRHFSGNSAILFPIRLGGRRLRLRCYTRTPGRDLRRLYGERLYEQELLLFNGEGAQWVDVVVEEWIEGMTLEECIAKAAKAGDCEALKALSEGFEQLAAGLLAAPWAHGDLKPENIIVTPSGEEQLIDFDACYLPDEGLHEAPERGTPAYQHPSRGAIHDRWIDHYPIALISVQLRALALDPSLYARFYQGDGLLLHPERLFEEPTARFNYRRPKPIALCEGYRELCELFSLRGEARYYRLARLLQYESHRLPDVEELISFRHPDNPIPDTEVYYDRNLAGFATASWRSPLLFDEAFEFQGERATVRIGDHWHEIDRTLRTRKPTRGPR